MHYWSGKIADKVLQSLRPVKRYLRKIATLIFFGKNSKSWEAIRRPKKFIDYPLITTQQTRANISSDEHYSKNIPYLPSINLKIW